MGYPYAMSKTVAPEAPKRAGRKPKAADGESSASLSRDAVIAHALKLVQQETADAITIARLAADLGVSTGLIHYFVGSRDAMLARVLNESLRSFVGSLHPPTGHWREDLASLLVQTHRSKLTWKGVTTYLAEHNRYRLFHEVGPGERDYGLAFFDRFGRIMQSGGFSGAQAAMAYHLSMLFLESVAVSHLRHRMPAEHNRYLLDHMAQFDAEDHAGAAFMMESFASLDTDTTFSDGLAVLLNAFEGWLPPPGAGKARKQAARPASNRI
jgi:AcrR family transcriptional regulator